MNGKFKPGTSAAKHVVVGAAAPSLQDVHTTSTTGERADAGPRDPGARDLRRPLDGFPLQAGAAC